MILLKRSVFARMAGATLLALTACSDLPTALPPAAPGAEAQLNQGQHTGQEPFFCTVSEYAPSSPTGRETRRVTVFIPRGELDDAGRTVRYAYHRVFASGRIFSSTLCVVPYTEGALRRVDRVFGVEKNSGADQFRARQEMITTQGCVGDDFCPLDPLVITAPVKPTVDPDDACTRYPDECGSGGGGGDDGGDDGGGGDAPWEGDDDGDGDTLDEGPAAFTACVAIGMGLDGWGAIAGSAWVGYQLYEARSDVRNRYTEYYRYNTSHAGNDEWSQDINDLYYQNYLSARRAEQALWIGLGGSSAYAALKIGAAVKTCAPLLAAPTA